MPKFENFDFWTLLDQLDELAATAGTTEQFLLRASRLFERLWRAGHHRPGIQTLSWMLRRAGRLDPGQDLLSALTEEVELSRHAEEVEA